LLTIDDAHGVQGQPVLMVAVIGVLPDLGQLAGCLDLMFANVAAL
jgi:hypothetical protein